MILSSPALPPVRTLPAIDAEEYLWQTQPIHRSVSWCTNPVRIVEETTDWVGHPPEYLQRFRNGLEALRRTGTAILYD